MDCGGTGWLYLEPGDSETDSKSPCPTCKPYGSRVKATSILHAPGARVRLLDTHRTGVVLRAWRRSAGTKQKRIDPYVMCDVRYDDGLPGVAWERNLVPYTPPVDARDMGPIETDERGEPFPF